MLSIREAETSDEPFLREMLYHSLRVADGDPSLDRDVVARGRPGDFGLIAVEATIAQAVGAIWMRFFCESDRGFGFVHSSIPELGIAVLPSRRGCGVGSALLRSLLQAAGAQYEAVSLRVSVDV
jgi:GNAT superfamily N-acetyltransferase